jgi:hypothetical protein
MTQIFWVRSTGMCIGIEEHTCLVWHVRKYQPYTSTSLIWDVRSYQVYAYLILISIPGLYLLYTRQNSVDTSIRFKWCENQYLLQGYHECLLAHYLCFPQPNSWDSYAKNSKTHSLFKWVFTHSGVPPPTPTPRSGDTHQTHKCQSLYLKNQSCISANIFWLRPGRINSLHLKHARCGFFQIGLRNSEVNIKNASLIIWPNELQLDSGWAEYMEAKP